MTPRVIHLWYDAGHWYAQRLGYAVVDLTREDPAITDEAHARQAAQRRFNVPADLVRTDRVGPYLWVLVPHLVSHAARLIDPGSAIVAREPAREADPATLLVYYEGNRYGTAPDFADRLATAAGRLLEGYPTVARAWLPVDDFDLVGLYDPTTRALLTLDAAPLARWQAADAAAPSN